ncbi:MAG: helix-turn-helix domain-containing protein [Caulobacter sp.]|nr:helix-turn-helix domain-containing protein [Caulobacter sp.]
MKTVSFTLKPGEQPRFSKAELAQRSALTDAEIEAEAEADADNPPVNEARLKRMVLARNVRLIREQSGLSQSQFAARYRIGLGRLRDYEQARSEPDLLVQVVYRLIHEDPDRARSLVEQVERVGLT